VIVKLKKEKNEEYEDKEQFLNYIGISPIISKLKVDNVFSFDKCLDDNTSNTLSCLINNEAPVKENNKIFFDLSTLNKLNGK
jgi:hypothetical protein